MNDESEKPQSNGDQFIDLNRGARPVKMINRVSQESCEENVTPDAFQPGPRKHFKLKRQPVIKPAEHDGQKKEALFSDIDYTKPDYVNRLVKHHRNPINPKERYHGDWLTTPFGTVLRWLFKIAFYGGAIWSGIYFWNQGITTFIFAVLIVMLVWGVISSGMELGENSPFLSDASWVRTVHIFFIGF